MGRVRLLLGSSALTLIAAAASAQSFGPGPAIPPIASIVSGGTGVQVQPQTVQGNINVVSPFAGPYWVIADGPGVTPGATTQSAATRTRNRQQLSQWSNDINVTSPGAMGQLGDYPIEVDCVPSAWATQGASSGSVDFRNTTSKRGAKILGVRQDATLVVYNGNDNTKPVQCPGVRIGGGAQDITLSVKPYLGATTDPVVSSANATFSNGVMTIDAPQSHSSGAISSAANTKGQFLPGQNILYQIGGTSTVPINCYIVSQASGTTGVAGTYNMGGSCGPGYTNAVSQVVYGGQAGEVALDGVNGATGFDVGCPTQFTYDLFATGRWARDYGFPPVNASVFGSCVSGNNSFSGSWFVRGDPVTYEFWDSQGWNSGSSGDTFASMYFSNGGADLSMCGVESKYFMNGSIRNCESSNVAKVERADYLNPNTAGTGQQTNLVNAAIWYQVGGNTQDSVGTFHFESNTYNCQNAFGIDNGALMFQGSGTSNQATNLQAISTTLLGCGHFAIHYLFGTDVHVHDGVIADGGTSGGSGSWVLTATGTATISSNVMTVSSQLTGQFAPGQILSGAGITVGTTITSQTGGTTGGAGTYALTATPNVASPETMTGTATVEIATSRNSALTRATVQVDQIQIQNSPGGITLGSYLLPSNDANPIRFTSLPTVQIFNTSGSPTWYMPTMGGLLGATTVDVLACGSGGGGGSGAQETLGVVGSGGGGGAGGSCGHRTFSASELTATEAVSVGVGGTVGTATSGTGAGNAGGIGNASTFGSTLVVGYGGGGGGPGQTANSSAGGGGGGCGFGSSGAAQTGGTGSCGGGTGGAGANGGSAAGAQSGGAGGGSSVTVGFAGGASWLCPGGSSGGTLLAATASPGIAGTSPAGAAIGGTAGAGAGGNGAQITTSTTGSAGGSGAANTAGAGFAPGTSSNCAGGSGSGAGTANGVAGAAGGTGLVVVRTF